LTLIAYHAEIIDLTLHPLVSSPHISIQSKAFLVKVLDTTIHSFHPSGQQPHTVQGVVQLTPINVDAKSIDLTLRLLISPPQIYFKLQYYLSRQPLPLLCICFETPQITIAVMQFTTYCTTVKVLVYAEAINIERACNIIKTLNKNVNLFENFDVEAVCIGVNFCSFLLTLLQNFEESVQYIHNSPMNWV
jgi:hypothetical protein